MNKLIMGFGLMILSAQLSYAGSDVAYTSCKSENGRITLDLQIWDISGGIQYASVKFDQASSVWGADVSSDSSDGVSGSVVVNYDQGIYVVVIPGSESGTGNYKFLTFYADPKTFKRAVGDVSKFTGTLETLDPRNNDWAERTLNCTLEYSI